MPKTIRCPNCREKLDYLNYNQGVTEYGSASLPEEIENIEDIYGSIDYEGNDSEYDTNINYSCPECDYQVELLDLIIEEDNEEKEKKKEDGIEILGGIDIDIMSFKETPGCVIQEFASFIFCKYCKKNTQYNPYSSDAKNGILCDHCKRQMNISKK
jgi:hypothetical protein